MEEAIDEDGADESVELEAEAVEEGSASGDQGCKIRSGRDRIIRIIAIGIWSEFCQKSSKFCSHSWNRSGKAPAKTGFTKNHPEQENQKTMWSTSEEATDTQ